MVGPEAPTSLINMRPVPGWKAKVNGFRNPNAQIEGCAPGVKRRGYPAGIEPSALIRSIFPRRLLRVWAFAATAFSPTAT